MRGKSPDAALFAVTQALVPIGQRALPWLPERLSRDVLAGALRRTPSLWGMFADSKRLRAAQAGYQRAFPDADIEAFLATWLAVRGEDLATCMVYMARASAGRRSRLVVADRRFRLDREAPCIVAVLHYSTDPMLQLRLLEESPARAFLWPLYPLQEGIEDDRRLWLRRAKLSTVVERSLLSIAQPTWLLQARSQLERGGAVCLAMDAPFDRRSEAKRFLRVGETTLPLAYSIEWLWEQTGAQLLFAWPEPCDERTWRLNLQAVPDVATLGASASLWIACNPYRWAGWPFLRWRESSVSMRRHVNER